jgi:sugar O-acyltransferase (sialic acid O-acetyltransferase NeuD family)
MSRSLLIVGAGGHGRVVADAAQLTGQWKKIAFIDDRHLELRRSAHRPVIGAVADLDSLVGKWSELVVAIGDNTKRLEVQQKVRLCGFEIASVLHPSARIAEDIRIGEGTVVFANAVINTGSVLGDSCIVNTAATVDHDNHLGDGVHVSPGVHLAGDVKIGDRSWVGIGAIVIQGCSVGHDVIVGAGAVVTKNIGDDLTVAGVPAREIVK